MRAHRRIEGARGALWLVLLAVGCGGASASGLPASGGKPFSQETLNDPQNRTAQVAMLERLAKSPPGAGLDLVLAVTGSAEITGLDLGSGKTWSFAHPLDHRPQIAGPLVIGSGGGEVFALDGRTGATKWTVKASGKFVGAGSDGSVTALSFRGGEGGSLVVVGAGGATLWDKSTTVAIGIPAVAAGAVFVPWKALYVTAFDAQGGGQVATWVTDTETSRVVPIGGALFAGQGRLVRFDADLVKATAGGSHLAAPPKNLADVTRRELFVLPEHDERTGRDAIDATTIAGRPLGAGDAGFAAGRIYGAYYRLVMGLDASSAKPAWVATQASDVVALGATKDGVVVVESSGTVTAYSAERGAVGKSWKLGKPALSASIEVDTLSLGGGGDGKPFVAQLRDALTTKADELATAQIFLTHELAALPDEEATKLLLDVADGERTAGPLREEARKGIAQRTNGTAAMLALLGRHADFLHDTTTPPVGPMAKALAAMKEKAAAKPLLAQLFDPALPQRDLVDTAEAVAALATADLVPQLQRFVTIHRGSAAGNLALSDAVGVIAVAASKLDTAKGKAWLSGVLADRYTDVDVRTTIEKLLEQAAAKKPADKGAESPANDDGGKKAKEKYGKDTKLD
jgi:outer membrane protein assembly factor BamB